MSDAFTPDDERVGGDRQHLADRKRQRDLHIGARHEQAFLVRQRDLDLHGARGHVNRAGRPCYFATEILAWQFCLGNGHRLTHLDQLGLCLRHIDIDAQRIGLRKQEQGAAASRINQVTDVNVAAQDHARERCHHPLEAGEVAQAIHVGIGGGNVGTCLRFEAAPFIQLLLRYGILLPQGLPAVLGAARQTQAGGCLGPCRCAL